MLPCNIEYGRKAIIILQLNESVVFTDQETNCASLEWADKANMSEAMLTEEWVVDWQSYNFKLLEP